MGGAQGFEGLDAPGSAAPSREEGGPAPLWRPARLACKLGGSPFAGPKGLLPENHSCAACSDWEFSRF